MKLTEEMKNLMAWCYASNKARHYEFVMDKRDNYFGCRIFHGEDRYFMISIQPDSDHYKVQEFEVPKSFYHPSARVTIANKIFARYRSCNSYDKVYLVPTDKLIPLLDKLPDYRYKDEKNRDDYKEYQSSVWRATGRF